MNRLRMLKKNGKILYPRKIKTKYKQTPPYFPAFFTPLRRFIEFQLTIGNMRTETLAEKEIIYYVFMFS